MSGIIIEAKENKLLDKLKQVEGYEEVESVKGKITE